MAKKRTDWTKRMSQEETAIMKRFIVRLYEVFNESGNDRYIDHILRNAVRDVTRIIGENQSLKISREALNILELDKCPDLKTIEKAQENHRNKTVKDHFKPVKEFYKDFEGKKTKGESFTEKDADIFFKEACIVIITSAEHALLAKNGQANNRPDPLVAYNKAGIELEDVK